MKSVGRVLLGGMAMVAAAAAGACGGSAISADRVERSIAPTFANLVAVQVSSMGLPPMRATQFAVTAICRKPMAGQSSGSGEWVCGLTWKGPDEQVLNDSYDLFVTTDGCYAATMASENLGGPTLRAKDGRQVRNLLYAFEGCFDTT